MNSRKRTRHEARPNRRVAISGKFKPISELHADVQHMAGILSTWADDILHEANRWPDSTTNHQELLDSMRTEYIGMLIGIGYVDTRDEVEASLAEARELRSLENPNADADERPVDVAVEIAE